MLPPLSSSAQCRYPRLLLLLSSVKHEHGISRRYTGASAKLFADSVAEETEVQADSPSNKLSVNEYPNWNGEESVQDAVLRMLVDKYKPLRGASIRTADEKLMSTPPGLGPPALGSLAPSSSRTSVTTHSNTTNSGAHKPWLTTFRAPSSATSIKHMRLHPAPPLSGVRSQGPPIHPDDSRARIELREQNEKAAYAGRLINAFESSFDYRLGKPVTTPGNSRIHNPNPASIKGWMSLVEERIQRARSEGHFRTVKGRGKPLVREHEETNPFIPREEFLMNRIVRRQGAAPPWVEIQGELEAAVTSFREVLRSTWIRRAIRTLTLERPPALLPTLTLVDVTGERMRDPEWEARETSYHEKALGELNALVRKYNGVAPYTVRRTFLTRQAELDRMYKTSGADILAEIKRRVERTPSGAIGPAAPGRQR